MYDSNQHALEKCKFCDLTHHYAIARAYCPSQAEMSAVSTQYQHGDRWSVESYHSRNTHSLLTELSSISEQDKQV